MAEIITFGAAFDPSGVSRGVAEANRRLNELAVHGKKAEAAFTQASTSTTRFSQKGLATIQALNAGTKITSTAMQRLAADVRLASADFRGGRISTQDFSTAIQMAQQSALGLRARGIVPVGADLAAFNTVMRSTGTVTQPVVRGLGTVRSSLGSLGAMALGAKGTLGTLGSALGFMAFGNLATIGIFAGIAGIAAAFRLITKDSREAKKQIDAFIDSLRKQELKAFVPGRSLASLQVRRGELEAQIAGLPGLRVGREGRPLTEGEIASRTLAIQKELNVVLHDIGLTRGSIAEDAAKTAKADADARKALAATRLEAELVAEARSRIARITAGMASPREMLGRIPMVSASGLPVPSAAEAAAQAAMAGLNLQAMGLDFETLDLKRQEIAALIEHMRAVNEDTKANLESATTSRQVWAAIISGAGSLVQSLIRGDMSAGAAIGGIGATIGGAVSIANPLFGLGIGAASGALGALFGGGGKKELPVRDDSSRRELVAIQKKLDALEARRPKQTTFQFVVDGRVIRTLMSGINREDALLGGALLG